MLLLDNLVNPKRLVLEEINDNMITENKPDKFIYRTKLFEILCKHSRKKPDHPQIQRCRP